MLSGLLRESTPEYVLPSLGTQANSWPTLLIVDSDQEMALTLVCYFEKRGFHVAAALTLAEARDLFHRRKTWNLVIADYHLPDGTGWELCCWMRERAVDTPFLLMSGSPHCASLCSGTDFLRKPFTLAAIDDYVRTLADRN